MANTAPEYHIASCNNDIDDTPDMTIRIAQTFFDENLADRKTDFSFNDEVSHYEMTISFDELELAFPDNENGMQSVICSVTSTR